MAVHSPADEDVWELQWLSRALSPWRHRTVNDQAYEPRCRGQLYLLWHPLPRQENCSGFFSFPLMSCFEKTKGYGVNCSKEASVAAPFELFGDAEVVIKTMATQVGTGVRML